jgi:hypothetical protein
VLNPIPTSAKSIRGSGFWGSGGYRTSVLRFNISEPDIQLVLKSDQFNEIEYVKYNNNILSFAESKKTMSGWTSFLMFGDFRKWFTPSWFEFDKWNAFKAYLVEKHDIEFHKVRLLIYNPDINQAYFIDHEMRGP